MFVRSLIESAVAPLQQARALFDHRERLAPSPPAKGLLGHLPELRRGPLGAFLGWRRALGDLVRLRFGTVTAHLVAHPDFARHVLIDHHKNYDKQTRGFNAVRWILGNGLLTSEGAFWRRQRRIAQPAFHRERIASIGEAMIKETLSERTTWDDAARGGSPVDVTAAMSRLTMRIAAGTLLSTDVSTDTETVGRALNLLLGQFNERLRRPVLLPPTIPTPENRRAKRALAELDAVVYRAIAARRASRERPSDLLTMLMDAVDEETGERMSDLELRDEVMTIFLAGHETTANAMSWTLYLLSRNPDARARLEAEIDAELGGEPVRLEDLGRLRWTADVLSEAMRLFPPAWMIGRRAVLDDEIGGYFIPRGSLALVSPYVIHHHPDHWPNPEGFDPARWSSGLAQTLPKCAYFPFGAGPRICIGQGFALMEAKIILATLVQRHRFDLVGGVKANPEPTVTLRPRDGLAMRVTRRAD